MPRKNETDVDMALPKNVDSVRVMFPKKYLAKEDLRGKDVTLTIAKVTRRNVRNEDNTTSIKVCIHFAEMERRPPEERKVWIIGVTVGNQIAAVLDETNPHKWPGQRITIYPDPTITAFGKVVGGIRVRPDRPPERGAENGTRKKYLTALDEETIRVEVGEELARRGVGSLAECSTEQLKDIYETVTAENPLA